MSWRVEGKSGQFVAWDGAVSADPVTREELNALIDGDVGVMVTPTGPVYQVAGVGDEYGVFHLALAIVESAKVTGIPPQPPASVDSSVPEGATT